MADGPTNGALAASALSTDGDFDAALAETTDAIRRRMGDEVDVVMVFVSHHHAVRFSSLGAALQQKLGAKHVMGCTGEAVAGRAVEVEKKPALALWAARLPGVDLRPIYLEHHRTSEGGVFAGWPEDLPEPMPKGAVLLLLGEPFSFPADELLPRLNEDHPGLTVMGGMASGGRGPGRNRLFFGDRDLSTGAVGLLLTGGVRFKAVVSQGCRPIGQPFVITKCQKNIVLELGGKSALERLNDVFNELPAREQEIIQKGGLHLGRVVDEYKEKFEPGDFLIRNVFSADPEN
ncbi:MAG: FIST signal transduction protein, partial [Planctomycetia bacterium]